MKKPQEFQSDNATTDNRPPYFGPLVALNYAAFFICFGLYLPFFPVWLKSLSLTPDQIAIIISAPIFTRLLTMHLTAYADQLEDRGNALIGFSWITAIGFCAMTLVDGFYQILALQLALALFWNPIMPLIDAIALSGVRRFGENYGKIRLWGSVAFIVANVCGGIILAGYDISAILYVIVGAFLLQAIVSFSIPKIGKMRKSQTSAQNEQDKKLLRSRKFVTTQTATGLLQASHAMLYAFGSIYWVSLGYSGTAIGVLWAIGVIAEILLFQYSASLLQRTGWLGLMYIGALGGLVRWGLFPFDLGLLGFAFLQILHGLSFGAVHIAIQQFFVETVPEEQIGTAQGQSVLIGGMIMAVTTLFSGSLYSALGAVAFALMAAYSIAAIILLKWNHSATARV